MFAGTYCLKKKHWPYRLLSRVDVLHAEKQIHEWTRLKLFNELFEKHVKS
jgi:hypothetical protein